MKTTIAFLLISFVSWTAWAGSSRISYEGQIIRPDSNPMIASGIPFTFELWNTAGTCLLYRETASINTDSEGKFKFYVGGGTLVFPATPTELSSVIGNSASSLPCKPVDSSIGTYSPGPTDRRRIKIKFVDGATPVTADDFETADAPSAVVAQSVDGYRSDNLFKVNGSISTSFSTTAYNVLYNFANQLGVGGTITAIAPGSPQTFGNSTNFPIVTVDAYGRITDITTQAFSLGASSIADGSITTSKLADTGVTTAKLADASVTTAKVVDGSISNAKISDVAASKISGVLAVANGGTGVAVTAGDANKFFSVDGSGTGGTVKSLVAGSGINITNGTGSVTIDALNLGTVTSVGLNMPTQFSVGGTNPLTNSGTFNVNWVSQTANTVLAAPNGAAGVPTFRSLVQNDIPVLSNAGKVSNSATTATNLNTVGAIVARDASGDFAASQATLTGLKLSFGSGDLTLLPNGAPFTSYSLIFPTAAGTNGQVLGTTGSGNLTWLTPASGTVTSVGLSMPSIFSVSNSPVSSTGTLTVALANQNAKKFFAGPTNGNGANTPTFRDMTKEDVPALNGVVVLTTATGTVGTPYAIPQIEDKHVFLVPGSVSQYYFSEAMNTGSLVTISNKLGTAGAVQILINSPGTTISGQASVYLDPGAVMTLAKKDANSWEIVSSHKMGAVNCAGSGSFQGALVGDPGKTNTYCIETTVSADTDYHSAVNNCYDRGRHLCSMEELRYALYKAAKTCPSTTFTVWAANRTGSGNALDYVCNNNVASENEIATSTASGVGFLCCY
jgi:hypothetical protein